MKNIKRVLFQVKSSKNIFWDDTPIRIGCQLVVPDKFAGDQPLCIISHGSGGLGSDTDLFVDSLGRQGIATLCVDSFTGRSMEAIGWNDFSGYVSPRMRALETVEAYKFLCENHKNMFAGLNLALSVSTITMSITVNFQTNTKSENSAPLNTLPGPTNPNV